MNYYFWCPQGVSIRTTAFAYIHNNLHYQDKKIQYCADDLGLLNIKKNKMWLKESHLLVS